MTLIIHKYGGTSVCSVERIKNIAKRISKWHKYGYKLIIILSAMSKETNRLLNFAKQISKKPNLRELDSIISTGEQVSTGLLSIALNYIGINSISYTGWQIPIKTDNIFSNARIKYINKISIKKQLNLNKIIIITGFQGIDYNNNITTLGRGGSDTSAIAIASIFKSKECLIYTDVNGIYTTDPNIIKKAYLLNSISFYEILEMSSLGSKILHIRSIEFIKKYKIKTRILSSLTNPLIDIEKEFKSGTTITFKERNVMKKNTISGIAFQRDESYISIINIFNKPGIEYNILKSIKKKNIDIDMIIQSQEILKKKTFMFTICRNNYINVFNIINKLIIKKKIKTKEIIGNFNVSKISLIGVGMRSNIEIVNNMLYTLSKLKINIYMIFTSEIKISIIIDEKNIESAIYNLHESFKYNL